MYRSILIASGPQSFRTGAGKSKELQMNVKEFIFIEKYDFILIKLHDKSQWVLILLNNGFVTNRR